jgi:glycosyltransferase involved in cell wall biosynthesis
MKRTCVVLPTYNNGKTLGGVIRGVMAYVPDVIVVDDGSTDGTETLLREFPGVLAVRHGRNRGKGAAMMSGFARAGERGFDRAITIDTDGQHLTEDIPLFLEAAEREPGALFVGSRKRMGPVARASRYANRFSDFWFWLVTGKSLPDTQCGFRSYPLELIRRLRLENVRYDFEMEVLVKASWLGTALKPIPVTAVYFPAGQGVSHFRPFVDFFRIFNLGAIFFLVRFFLPSGFQKIMCDSSFSGVPFSKKMGLIAKDFFGEAASHPLNFSASVGMGLMMGILPIWGIQTLSATLLADRLGLNKFAAVLASNISFPLAAPFIFYGALVLGHALVTGQLDFNPLLHGGMRQMAAQKFAEWVLGSVVLAVFAGGVGGVGTYFLVGLINRFRGQVGDA